MTNLRQLIFPRIDSPTQESLKQSLITNSEAIISLAKSLSGVRVYRDLYETRIDGLDEVIGELR